MFTFLKKSLQIACLSLCILAGTTQSMAENLLEKTPEDLQELSFVGGYVRDHPTTYHVFLPFLNQVAMDLDHKITFKYYASNELYPESETYAVFGDGRVDFGVIRQGLFPKEMPLNTVLCLPYMAPNAVIGSLLAQDIAKEFPELQDEFPKNSELFALWTSAAYQLHSKTPIQTLADIKGKKIIAWEPPLYAIIEKLGGIPIYIRTTDSYEALRNGQADAILAPIAPIRSFKISDIATYHLILNLGVTSFSISCYSPRWEQFSQEVQKYFKSQGGALFSYDIAESIEAGAIKDKKHMQSLGQEFYTLTEADKKELQNIFANSYNDWVQSMPEDKQVIAKKILDYALERSAFYKVQYGTSIYGEWGELYE